MRTHFVAYTTMAMCLKRITFWYDKNIDNHNLCGTERGREEGSRANGKMDGNKELCVIA